MSKYRIVVQDQGESQIKGWSPRFMAEIQGFIAETPEWHWLVWEPIAGPYGGITEDEARKKAEAALDEIRNPPQREVSIYYYD